MVEKLLADLEALRAEVGVITRREFILARWTGSSGSDHDETLKRDERQSILDLLLVPSLVKNTSYTLNPFVRFATLVPRCPAFCCSGESVIAKCKPWRGTWFYELRWMT
jgi:hypothetical protein